MSIHKGIASIFFLDTFNKFAWRLYIAFSFRLKSVVMPVCHAFLKKQRSSKILLFPDCLSNLLSCEKLEDFHSLQGISHQPTGY